MKLPILFFLITTIAFGQTKYDRFDKLISEAHSYKTNGEYEIAIETYKCALEILVPNSSSPFFHIAYCALQIDNIKLADKWIRKGVSVGGAQMEYLRNYKGFTDIQEKRFYKKIISDYNSLRQQYFSTIENIDVYMKIEALTARDQFVRKAGMYLDGYSEWDYQNAGDEYRKALKRNDSVAAEKYKKILFHKTDEKYKETTRELMERIDSLNVAKLMEITKEHGWQERAWIILWHQRVTYGKDNYVWNYFKPLIDKEIEEGKLSKNFWFPFERFKSRMDELMGKKEPENKIKLKKEKIKK